MDDSYQATKNIVLHPTTFCNTFIKKYYIKNHHELICSPSKCRQDVGAKKPFFLRRVLIYIQKDVFYHYHFQSFNSTPTTSSILIFFKSPFRSVIQTTLFKLSTLCTLPSTSSKNPSNHNSKMTGKLNSCAAANFSSISRS